MDTFLFYTKKPDGIILHMGYFSCKTSARPRAAAPRRLGSSPSTDMCYWMEKEIRLWNTHFVCTFCDYHSVIPSFLFFQSSPLFLIYIYLSLHFVVVVYGLFYRRRECTSSASACLPSQRQWGSVSTVTPRRDRVLHGRTTTNDNTSFRFIGLKYLHFFFFLIPFSLRRRPEN